MTKYSVALLSCQCAKKYISNHTSLNIDSKASLPPEPLHNDQLFFTEPIDLKSSERPPESNNTPWGRARRSPCSNWVWDGETPPTLGQAWLLVYLDLYRCCAGGAQRRRQTPWPEERSRYTTGYIHVDARSACPPTYLASKRDAMLMLIHILWYIANAESRNEGGDLGSWSGRPSHTWLPT